MRKRAFSLIELILVMIILSIGLTTLILLLRYSVMQSADTHFYTIANWLCQEKIEEILSDRRDNGFGYIVKRNYRDEEPFPTYTRTTEIYYVNLDNLNVETRRATAYKRIKVSVSGGGSSTPLEMVSLVTNYDETE
ncbi:MAG: type II secretion system protein [Candidatus Omnitrophica bacterium]|nr:type II secretion system protein [Candidatus Omnitrophota bacterium]